MPQCRTRAAPPPPPPPSSPPSPIGVDASQGTATELANLNGDNADGLSPPDVSQPAEASGKVPEVLVEGHPEGPPGVMGNLSAGGPPVGVAPLAVPPPGRHSMYMP